MEGKIRRGGRRIEKEEEEEEERESRRQVRQIRGRHPKRGLLPNKQEKQIPQHTFSFPLKTLLCCNFKFGPKRKCSGGDLDKKKLEDEHLGKSWCISSFLVNKSVFSAKVGSFRLV